MAGSSRLDAYLALERVMLMLDADGDPTAELVRDQMDPIWLALDDSEHEYLNGREDVDPSVQYPCRVPIGADLYGELRSAPDQIETVSCSKAGRRFTDWACEAA